MTKKKYSFLHIENNDKHRELVKNYFNQNNSNIKINCETILTINELKQKISKKNLFDAVVASTKLNDGNIFDLLNLNIKIPVLFLIDKQNKNENIAEILNAGADNFIIKDASGNYLKILSIILPRMVDRHRNIMKLKENEAILKNINYNMADWFWEVDANGIYTFVSENVKNVLEYEPEELIGLSAFDIMAEWDIEKNKKLFGEVISKKKKIRDLENWCIKKTGEPICFNTSGIPILDDMGNLTGYRGIDKDITAKKNVEETLRKNEHKYRALFEQSKDAIFIISLDKKHIDVNSQACQMLGYTKEELLSMPVGKIISEECLSDSQNKFEALLRGEKIPIYQRYFKRKSGEVFPVEIDVALIYDGKGKPMHIQSIVRDITEQQNLQKALEQSKAKYKGIVEDQTEMICRYLPNGTLTFVNEAYCKYFNKHKYELIGNNFMPPIPEEDRKKMDNAIKSINKDKPYVIVEHRVIMPDKSIRWQRWTNRAIFDEEGNISEYQAVGMDITETKEAQKALKESEEKLRSTISSMDDIVFVLDKNGVFIDYYQPHSHNDLYVPPEQFIGKPFSTVLPENIVRPMTVAVEAVKITHKPQEFEYFIHMENHISWFLAKISPRLTAEGDFSGVTIVARNITDRKRSEERLRESETQFKAQYKNLPIPTYTWKKDDNDFILTDYNNTVKDLTNGNIRNSLGISSRVFYKDMPEIPKIMFRCFIKKNKITTEIAHEIYEKDNKYFNFTFIYVPPNMVMVHTENITEQKLANMRVRKERDKAQNYLDVAQVMLLALNDKGEITMINQRGCDILEYKENELIGKNWLETCIPEHKRKEVMEIFKHTVINGDKLIESVENYIITKSGKIKIIEWHNSIIRDDYGNITGSLSSGQDITRQKKDEENLRLLSQVFKCSNDAITITSPNAEIIDVNDSFAEITGYTREEVIGKGMNIMKSGKHNKEFYREMWKSLLKTGQWSGEIWDRRKNGEIYPKWVSISSITDDLNQTIYYISIFSDITVIKQAEEKLRRLAHYDMLTNLPNRVLFIDRLENALHRSKRYDNLLAVMFLDLDGFKLINDTLGHRAGDKLLIEVAERLSDSIRKSDTAARLGGDEFTVIMLDISGMSSASIIAERIINSLSKPYLINEKEVYVTASIGIAIYPYDGYDTENLIKNADTAMYHAKEMGKNNYQFFSEEMNNRVKQRMEMETNLRHAIERNEFIMYYQPQVNSTTGEIIGLEALLRWNHPEYGLLSPIRFIPTAEESGLILPIGEWTVEEVCRQIKEWERDSVLMKIPITVNISGKHFSQYDFSEFIETIIKKNGINPYCLALEITETEIMRDFKRSNEVFRKLYKLGVKTAIDDFGTGYSSLNYLKNFSVNTIKIDQSFIKDINKDENNAAITKAIIALAENLKLGIIAEGVETEEQLNFLKDNGCINIQGFYFSKPLEVKKLRELIINNKGKLLK